MLQRRLGHDPLGYAGHVRRGHVHDMRPRVARRHRLVERPGAEHVGSERLVDRRIELHARRAVEDDVEIARERRQLALNVALEYLDPLVEEAADALGSLTVAEPREARPAEELLQSR